MNRDWPRRPLAVGVLLSLLALSGCKTDTAPSQLNQAEVALDRALDAWVRGEPADKLASASPPVQADDPDWKSGVRLLSFLTVESKASPAGPGRFHCRVSLTLQDRAGKKLEKEVLYEVTMGETISVTRSRAR
jgi:hypothetical protein